MSVTSILLVGLLLGMRHALDADHLAAVATLVSRSQSYGQTLLQGILWGTGHTLTLLTFGGAVLVLGLALPETAAHALELGVGVMLVLLGADVLYRLRRDRIHFHVHRHAGVEPHFHAHSHRGATLAHDEDRHQHSHQQSHSLPVRALVVGMVHGMAGSAALILLTLETLRTPALGLAYIALFGLGSIVGMALLSVAIAVPMRWSSRRLGRAHAGVSALVGLGSMGVGFVVIYSSAGSLT